MGKLFTRLINTASQPNIFIAVLKCITAKIFLSISVGNAGKGKFHNILELAWANNINSRIFFYFKPDSNDQCILI